MHPASFLLALLTATAPHALALDRRLPAGVALTDNVLNLEVGESFMGGMPPSSEYLASLRRNAINKKRKRQNDKIANVTENMLTLGGRVYMANVTLGNRVYALVLDTGSSDTWAAQTSFNCRNGAGATVLTSTCGFGPLFNTSVSRSYKPYSPTQTFSVNYTSGEYLKGILATELFGIGDVGAGFAPRQIINQTIGIVQQGLWDGDGTSSGLMGLAYSRLASGSSIIGYESVIFTLFDQNYYPSVFSLALSRTAVGGSPRGSGGILAIGGIPNVNYDATSWSETAIVPVSAGVYTYYSITIDGYSITAPTGSVITPQNYTASRQRIIVDSGTTLIYLPDRITDYIASLFSPPAVFNTASQLYFVPCVATAPRVGVTIAGKTYYISRDDLMNRGAGAVGGAAVGSTAGQCVLAIQRSAGGASVLGDSFLKNVLVVFDLGNNKVRTARRDAL